MSHRLDGLTAAGVDEFTASVFDVSREARARTRALVLTMDS